MPQLIKPDKILIVLLTTVVVIVLLHLNMHEVRVLGKTESIFYLDEQITLGAYFVAVGAAVAGVLHLQAGKLSNRADLMKTSSLGVFLLLLSADEYFELHEYANTLVKDFLGTGFGLGSLAQISWIFPLLILILVVLLLIAKAAKEAPSKREKIAYLIGLFSFIIVLIFELVGSQSYGNDAYIIYVGVEEGMEMLGVSMFLYAGMLLRGAKKSG